MGDRVNRFRKTINRTLSKTLDSFDPVSLRPEEKLFRDPIFGFQRLAPHEVAIVDSPLFQRLRGISQTALAYLTYPSAIHSRFEHSLNCLHLADSMLWEISQRTPALNLNPKMSQWLEVRLAALLHDIGHSIFSHASEFYYSNLRAVKELREDQLFAGLETSPSEAVNYCIVTSEAFTGLWEKIVSIYSNDNAQLQSIRLETIGDIITGRSPQDDPSRHYQTDIVNGPFDVDKLDYLRRDSYFTGISLSIDVERLLASLKVSPYKNEQRNRKENRLVVDAKGIAAVEQLLFARMVLYDSVYHHHKVRAATHMLSKLLSRHGTTSGWKSSSKLLNSMPDFIEIDEYDFFGHTHADAEVANAISDLRLRRLYQRALVLPAMGFADRESAHTWAGYINDLLNQEHAPSQKISAAWFSKVSQQACRRAIAAARKDGVDLNLKPEEIIVDVPKPPGIAKLGEGTLVELAKDYCVPLSELFPFHKATNNYSTQYKYRSYVFGPRTKLKWIAFGMYLALRDNGVRLNDLPLILSYQWGQDKASEKLAQYLGMPLPKWQNDRVVPARENNE